MQLPDLWADPSTRRKYLAEKLSDGAICLVLGSGVSKPFGLPLWDELLRRMFEGHESDRPVTLDLRRQAEFFKVKFCGNDNATFMERVGDALYRGFSLDLESLKKNRLLSVIAALSTKAAGRRGGVVISFNYDDLLESFLALSGFDVRSVAEERYWRRASDVEVWHPHGFIPCAQAGRASKRIVLDQAEYSLIVGDDRHPWRQRLLSQMRSSVCIFVGLSLTDDNLDSLMIRAHETHAAKDTSTAFWGVWLTTTLEPAAHEMARSRGVFPLVVDDYSQFADELAEVVKIATDGTA